MPESAQATPPPLSAILESALYCPDLDAAEDIRRIHVAEAIGYLLDARSQGLTGQVIRVCGQNLVGA